MKRLLVVGLVAIVVGCGGGGSGSSSNGIVDDGNPFGMTLEEYILRGRPEGETHEGFFTPPDIQEIAAEQNFNVAELNQIPINENRCYFRVHSQQGTFIDLFNESAYVYFDEGAPLSGGFEVFPSSHIVDSGEISGQSFDLLGADGEPIPQAEFEIYNDQGVGAGNIVVGQTWFTPTSRVARIEQVQPCLYIE